MDALVVFDLNGRTIMEYKLRDYPSGKLGAALAGPVCQELTSSQLVYHQEAFGTRIAVVFGSAESPIRIETFFNSFLKVLEYYFDQKPTATVLDANSSAVFTLVGLMLDDGVPSLMEPSLVCALAPAKGSTTDIEYQGYRRQGLAYTTEEIFIDVAERLSLEVAPKQRKSGTASIYANLPRPVKCTVFGEINVLSRLSGTDPRVSIDLSLDPKAHVALHPCVDALQWKRQQVLQFTPPDQHSTIATYTLDSEHMGLVSGRLHLGMGVDQSEFEVNVSVAMDTVVKTIDNLQVSIIAPGAKSIKENRMTAGELTADSKQPHKFDWTFGASTPAGWEATLRGTVVDGQDPSYVLISYSLIGKLPSKTNIKSVQVPMNGPKKPYKGVRYRTYVDDFLVRS